MIPTNFTLQEALKFINLPHEIEDFILEKFEEKEAEILYLETELENLRDE